MNAPTREMTAAEVANMGKHCQLVPRDSDHDNWTRL